MKKGAITFLVIAMITGIAALTNPNQTRHKEVLRNRIKEYIQQSIAPNESEPTDEWSEAGNAIAQLLGGAIIDQIIEQAVSTENYVIFSLTKLTLKGETKTIGIGAFGNVYFTKELERTFQKDVIAN